MVVGLIGLEAIVFKSISENYQIGNSQTLEKFKCTARRCKLHLVGAEESPFSFSYLCAAHAQYYSLHKPRTSQV